MECCVILRGRRQGWRQRVEGHDVWVGSCREGVNDSLVGDRNFFRLGDFAKFPTVFSLFNVLCILAEHSGVQLILLAKSSNDQCIMQLRRLNVPPLPARTLWTRIAHVGVAAANMTSPTCAIDHSLAMSFS
jgi:hypothetical protein